MENAKILIIGAGPTGLALALRLKQMGYCPIVFEKRSINNLGDDSRSVNITLSHRGISALQQIGCVQKVKDVSTPVTGRTYHLDERAYFMPYTKLPGYCLHSIKRGSLELILRQQAEAEGVEVKLGYELKAIDSFSKKCIFLKEGSKIQVSYDFLFGTDGLNSEVRSSLHAEARISTHAFIYKKIDIKQENAHQLDLHNNSVNVWKDEKGMLLALPNADSSQSGLLHLKNQILDDLYENPNLLASYFPVLSNVVDRFADKFFSSADGAFRAVMCQKWFFRHSILFIGDAAHGMVPFYGQGCNAGLEDSSMMACLIEKTKGDFTKAALLFCETRPREVDAMSALSLQNLNNLEVKKSDFDLFMTQKTLELALEENNPNFRTEYFNIAFTSMPFDEALKISNQHKLILTHFARRMKGQNSFTTNDLQKVYQHLNLKK